MQESEGSCWRDRLMAQCSTYACHHHLTIEMLETLKKGFPVHTCTDILKIIFDFFAHLDLPSASEPPNYLAVSLSHFFPPSFCRIKPWCFYL